MKIENTKYTVGNGNYAIRKNLISYFREEDETIFTVVFTDYPANEEQKLILLSMGFDNNDNKLFQAKIPCGGPKDVEEKLDEINSVIFLGDVVAEDGATQQVTGAEPFLLRKYNDLMVLFRGDKPFRVSTPVIQALFYPNGYIRIVTESSRVYNMTLA